MFNNVQLVWVIVCSQMAGIKPLATNVLVPFVFSLPRG